MLLGVNSPVQGFTERGRATALAFGPGLMLWLPSAGPQDAQGFPEALHFLRLPNWAAGEDPQSYVGRVAGTVVRWRARVPNLVLVPGNEPDIEAGHDGGDIGAIAAALHGTFPGCRVSNPPLSVQGTSRARYDGCDVRVAHSYFERQAPETMGAVQLGASYRFAQGAGAPVYVLEFNVVQTRLRAVPHPFALPDVLAEEEREERAATEPDIDWPERNRLAALWLDQAERDGVAGVAFFLADAAPDWSSFDVGPEAAAEILSLRHPAPPQPPPQPPQPPAPPQPPPPPAPPSPVGAYARDVRPQGTGAGYQRERWARYIADAGNPAEAVEIATTYERDAPVAVPGYDINLIVAQFCVETGNGTSPRWRAARNAAGIGIYTDGTPDVQFGTIERGIRGHLELLSDYYGDGRKPWGVLDSFTPPFGFAHPLGKVALTEMDGVWAADRGYSLAIANRANDALGGVPPPAPPTHRYQIVRPVDCAVGQGSDGDFSHGGKVAGFYAIDYMCSRGTPIRASAAGTVGIIYHTDWNPISARTGPSVWIDHDEGHSTFSCHMSRIDVAVGDRVAQGGIIGLTGDPAIDGGFGVGAHLHWEISVGRTRVKMEDLEAAGIAGPWDGSDPVVYREEDEVKKGDGFSPEEQRRIFYGTDKPTAAMKKSYPYNPGWGIETAYGQLMNGEFKTAEQDFTGLSIVLGRCISAEEADVGTPGRSVRYFERGKLTALRQADGSYLIRVN